MPGGYTHLTMANELTERRTLERMPSMPAQIIAFAGPLKHYCELGVVSPDYPYLQLNSKSANHWADLMHYTATDGVIRQAIAILRGWQGERRDKGLMWLLGYFTHVVMDVVLHPVINIKVGDYATNQTKHRRCEMNQDVHVFRQRLNLSVKLSEFLNSGTLRCGPNRTMLDNDIWELWTTALERTYPAEFARNAPHPNMWHTWFGTMVDKIAEEGDWLKALSRHVLDADPAYTYPPEDQLEMTYIEDLRTPDGKPIHFDALFDKAKSHACELWPLIARGVLEKDDTFAARLSSWNLDTGKDPAGRYVFWG